MNDLKKMIYTKLQRKIRENIEETKKIIRSTKKSRDTASKSTAGDKHETGRAMMQNELEMQEDQLNKIIEQKNILTQINFEKAHDTAILGSLIHTNHESYFISIGLGKIEVDNIIIYAISAISPIAQVLLYKKSGDQINFRNKTITIMGIE